MKDNGYTSVSNGFTSESNTTTPMNSLNRDKQPKTEKEERCGSCGEPMTDECRRLMLKKCQHRWRQVVDLRTINYPQGGGGFSERFYCVKCLEVKSL